MNNNDSKFSAGFLMGLLLGGGLVFLIGTRTGKNLMKIVSEQGFDGIMALLEDYGLDDLEEYEEIDSEDGADYVKEHTEDEKQSAGEKKTTAPKKRFFKRIRK